jgi:hypothetical protein
MEVTKAVSHTFTTKLVFNFKRFVILHVNSMLNAAKNENCKKNYEYIFKFQIIVHSHYINCFWVKIGHFCPGMDDTRVGWSLVMLGPV